MDLEDSDLVEMGFTKGQRMKIEKIIQSIKVRRSLVSNLWTCFMEYIVQGSKEENGSSQTKAASKPVQTSSGASGKCSIESTGSRNQYNM